MNIVQDNNALSIDKNKFNSSPFDDTEDTAACCTESSYFVAGGGTKIVLKFHSENGIYCGPPWV